MKPILRADNPAICCSIPLGGKMHSIREYQTKLLNAQTQKEQNQAMYEWCKASNLLANLDENDKPKYRELAERFEQS